MYKNRRKAYKKYAKRRKRRTLWKGGVYYDRQQDRPNLGKSNLTLEEASAYSGIGINKIRDLSMERNCNFVLFVGTKRLIKRRQFDAYIDKAYSI